MVTLFVKHAVEDYARWKVGYDEFAHVRQEMGVTAASVHRDPEDPNMIIVMHKFDDVESMLALINSEDLRAAMVELGVIGPPDIWLSEDIEYTDF